MSDATATERLVERLRHAGVTPVGRDVQMSAQIHAPGEAFPGQHILPVVGEDHRVSCLMVTTGDRFTIPFAVECYRHQLYPNRELVVVTYADRAEAVRAMIDACGVADASVHGVGRELSLGDMRNVAIARSSGEILIQWDDDDLSDPGRITLARAVLLNSGAAAAMQFRLVIWQPQQALAAISLSRMWEGTVAVWRRHAPVYPSISRREDTLAAESLLKTRPVATISNPLFYVYVVHGANTCEDYHFDYLVKRSACVLRGEGYEALLSLLGERMPVAAYREALAAAERV